MRRWLLVMVAMAGCGGSEQISPDLEVTMRYLDAASVECTESVTMPRTQYLDKVRSAYRGCGRVERLLDGTPVDARFDCTMLQGLPLGCGANACAWDPPH